MSILVADIEFQDLTAQIEIEDKAGIFVVMQQLMTSMK
jgi:hypothetical protein